MYADGKMISTPEEMGGEPMFFSLAMQYEYAGQELETKRGIKIGSTVRDLASAYQDCEFSVLGQNDSTIVTGSELEKSYKESGGGFIVLTVDKVNGEWMTYSEYLKWLEEQGGMDAAMQDESNQISSYSMDFTVQGDTIQDSQIRYTEDVGALMRG